jgi:hypothetical protein
VFLRQGHASRAFKELVDRGFIEETRHGGLSKKTRYASEWRLTAFKCDLTGSLKTCAFMQRGGSEYSSHAPQRRGPSPGALRPSPVRINYRECPKKLPTLSETTPDEAPECPKQLPTQADFEPSPVRNNYPHIIYQVLGTDTAARNSPARPADTAITEQAFDVVEGSFRIDDRRIELRSPVAALSLSAAQLAQQLADSHPSNARYPDSAQRTVDALTPHALVH